MADHFDHMLQKRTGMPLSGVPTDWNPSFDLNAYHWRPPLYKVRHDAALFGRRPSRRAWWCRPSGWGKLPN